MPRYVPVSTNAALIFAAPDCIFHPGFWQSSFLTEYNEISDASPNVPTLTSPIGGENLSSRYFSITWTDIIIGCERDPCVTYSVQYSTDCGETWFYSFDNYGEPMTDIPSGTTSVVWDLGAIPDTTCGVVRIYSRNTYGCYEVYDEGDFFTISGGTCF